MPTRATSASAPPQRAILAPSPIARVRASEGLGDASSVKPAVKVAATDGPAEQEAERIADTVMHSAFARPLAQACSSREHGGTTAKSSFEIPSSSSFVRSLDAARATGGMPLATRPRAELERDLGRDLSAIRIHTDRRAAALSESIGARAFTLNRDVFFASDELELGTRDGRHLMLHELAHTIQKTGVIQRSPPKRRSKTDGLLSGEDEELAARLIPELLQSQKGDSNKLTKKRQGELKKLVENLSPRQRADLRTFLDDHVLPPDFFSDEGSKLDVGQRLELAAYMVSRAKVGRSDAVGTQTLAGVSSADSDDLMQQIHNYADLSPARGGGRSEAEDPTGRLHFGAGEQVDVEVGSGVKGLEVGDWLEVSLPGQRPESVMFAGWRGYTDKKISKARPRKAAVYRREPSGGAVMDFYWLSGREGKTGEDVHEIHSVQRMGATATQPQSFDPTLDSPAALSATPEERVLVRQGLKTSLKTIVDGNYEVTSLHERFIAKAEELLVDLDLAAADRARLEARLADARKPKGSDGVAIYDLSRMAALLEELDFRPVTGIIDQAFLNWVFDHRPSLLPPLHDAPRSPAQLVETSMSSSHSARAAYYPSVIPNRVAAEPDAAMAFGEREERRLFADSFHAEFQEVIDELFGGSPMTDAQIYGLFSERQIALLEGFMRDRRIPAGLFTDELETPLSTMQRMLLSAHILTTGRIRDLPRRATEPVEDKPRAAFCGHWVRWVWTYAAVSPMQSFAGKRDSELAIVDPTGRITFGVGSQLVEQSKEESDLKPTGTHGRLRTAKKLQENDELMAKTLCGDTNESCDASSAGLSVPYDTEGIDPELLEDINALEVDDWERLASGTVPKTRARKKAMREFQGADLLEDGTLLPGDWLVVYNGNATGTHSIFFAGWNGPRQGDTRMAKVFHQGSPGRFGTPGGGAKYDDTYQLGYPQSSKDTKTQGIVRVMRVGDENRPAQTADELLRFQTSRDKAIAETAAYIKRRKLDLEEIVTLLKGAIAARLEALAPGESYDSSEGVRHTLGSTQWELFRDIVDEHPKDDQAPTVEDIVVLTVVLQELTLQRATGMFSKELHSTLSGKKNKKKK